MSERLIKNQLTMKYVIIKNQYYAKQDIELKYLQPINT